MARQEADSTVPVPRLQQTFDPKQGVQCFGRFGKKLAISQSQHARRRVDLYFVVPEFVGLSSAMCLVGKVT